jgi:hypothetical protein
MHTKFESKNLKGRGDFGDVGADEKIILKRILNKTGARMWAGFSSLRIGSSFRLL